MYRANFTCLSSDKLFEWLATYLTKYVSANRALHRTSSSSR